jgi:FtsH-binding integral membrane protein
LKPKFDFFKGFEWFTEAIGWIQIFLSPFLIGCIISFFIYLNFPTPLGLAVSIGIVVIFSGIGIYFANKIWKKTGTIAFLSRLDATPELDKKDESN